MTGRVNDDVRAEVRRLLERAPAYGSLSPSDRRDMARDLVRVGSFLADRPDWLDLPAPAPAARAIDDLKRSLAGPRATTLQGTGDQFHAGATSAGVDQFKSLVGSVDFSEFVGGLIRGVFKAIVDASIEQMNAFRDLVSSVSQSVQQFSAGLTDDDGKNYMMGQFPGTFSSVAGQLRIADGQQPTDQLLADLNLPKGSDLSSPITMQLAVQNAKLKMAQQQQQMLATMVMLGINRIVVTDGRINARVLFDINAKDTAQATSSTTTDQENATTDTESWEDKGFWGTPTGHKHSITKTSSLSVRSASSAKSDSELQLNAQLSGEVAVNFKSETMPLERLAAGRDIQRIQANAMPVPTNNAPLPTT